MHKTMKSDILTGEAFGTKASNRFHMRKLVFMRTLCVGKDISRVLKYILVDLCHSGIWLRTCTDGNNCATLRTLILLSF